MEQYYVYTEQGQPNRSSPFAPACSLSLPSKTLVSLVLNQVCHVRLFWIALRVFSITDLVFLSFRPVSFSHAFFGLHRSLLLLCLPLCFPKESRVISRQSFQRRRVLCNRSSKSSISIIFYIGYERLLIKYMLKESPRFQFSRLLSNTSLLYCIVLYLLRFVEYLIINVTSNSLGLNLGTLPSVPRIYDI